MSEIISTFRGTPQMGGATFWGLEKFEPKRKKRNISAFGSEIRA